MKTPRAIKNFLKAYSPPSPPEVLSEQKIAAIFKIRFRLIAVALVLEPVFFFKFSQAPRVNADLLYLRESIVIPLLLLDAFLVFVFLRKKTRFYSAISVATIIVEMSASMFALQMGGMIATFLHLFYIAYILGIRIFVGYREGIAAIATFTVYFTAIFVSENMGTLEAASLFVFDRSNFFNWSVFRHAGFFAILWFYIFFFGGTNLILSIMRSTDRALQSAKRTLFKVEKGAQKGRLSGHILSDRYELQDIIGRGGMAEIYRAKRLSDDKECSVKVLHPHLVSEQNILRFRREAEVAKRLPKNVVPSVLDFEFDIEQECFIVMEYLRGEDLGAFLRRKGTLVHSSVIFLIDQTARALDAIHDVGIVHRDLKPQNVFLEQMAVSKKNIKLLDFGISKLDDNAENTLTQPFAVMGSPGFMAPEQALGESSNVGPEADIFGLGAIAYEALTGERPFRSNQLSKAIHEILNVDPDPPSQKVDTLPPEIDDVILKALAKNPQDRYNRASAFSNALIDALNETPTEVEDLPS